MNGEFLNSLQEFKWSKYRQGENFARRKEIREATFPATKLQAPKYLAGKLPVLSSANPHIYILPRMVIIRIDQVYVAVFFTNAEY